MVLGQDELGRLHALGVVDFSSGDGHQGVLFGVLDPAVSREHAPHARVLQPSLVVLVPDEHGARLGIQRLPIPASLVACLGMLAARDALEVV